MVVLVCGGRDFKDADFVFASLDEIHKKTPITRLVHGDARGADKLAHAWARMRKVQKQPYPADWDR